MSLPPIDWIAVLVSIVAAMAVGSVWYAPFAFMKPWLKGIEKTAEQLASPAGPMALMVAMTVLKALGVALLLGWTGWSGVGGGLVAGLFLWAAATLPTQAMEVAFENRPPVLYGVNLGHSLASFAAIGFVQGLFA